MGKKQKKVTDVKAKVEEDITNEEDADIIKDDETKIKTESETVLPNRNKQARLIVRNLSFKATEDKLKKYFSTHGEITDVQVLRRQDGRLVGCGFVEFSTKTNAAKAIAHTSGRPFLNRPIVVDWAVPKDKFVEKTKQPVTDDSEESGFHDDDVDDKSKIVDASIVKEEDLETETQDSDNSSVDDSHSDIDSSAASENEDDDEDDNDEDDNDESDGEESEEDRNLEPRKPLRESHDISEGCTVFVKNIPFSVDNQELRKSMHQFGPIYYALVCIDPMTEHSKGTGFVKFRTKDAAQACLAAGQEGNLVLRSTVVETQPAVSREDLHKDPKKRSDSKRDGRNLYLIKEGVILAGSPAASGVSQADMAKRLQLEQWKTQMLKNLNKFVSRNRLVIQNLPPTYDDLKLRSLCLKYGGTKPVVTEARVMRDLRNVDASGKGKSKEFGFVCFTSHENALHALRSLNNNPDIFTPAKRPIVAFSIEDKKALNIRQKRLEKSKAFVNKPGQSNIPTQKNWEKNRQENKLKKSSTAVQEESTPKGWKHENTVPSVLENSELNEEKKLSKKDRRKLKKKKSLEKKKEQPGSSQSVTENPKTAKFVGEKSKEGQIGSWSRQKLREQAEVHSKTLKTKNKKERMKKQLAAVKIKQPKQKLGKPKDLRKEDNFTKLVNKYKTQLASSETERKKWYEQ